MSQPKVVNCSTSRTAPPKPTTIKSTNFSKLNSKYRDDEAADKKVLKSFDIIREDCIKNGKLFVDEAFKPIKTSIDFSGVTRKEYEWKRPSELVDDPRFFIEGAERLDIQQGELGDCWLLAAICCLTMNPRLFHLVVPTDQGFVSKYAGIFHFRFWQYGKWIDVIIDDLLPTYKGKLCFMHSKTKNEFWCALLEKAYAKMYGGYGALRGGQVSESLVDLTGGVVESIDLTDPPKNLYTKLKRACEREAMMACAVDNADLSATCEGKLANGLVTGHAYSVTKVKRIPYLKSKVELLRIYNPWGNEAEWRGSWSDKSSEWNSVSEKERTEIGLTFDEDGEFWMSFKDFLANFSSLDICDITTEVFNSTGVEDQEDVGIEEEVINKRQWKMTLYEDEWIPDKSAGGSICNEDTFATNPQKVVHLSDAGEGSDDCALIVSLMQKHVREQKRFGAEYESIGFIIYKLPPNADPNQRLTSDFFKYNESCGEAPFFLAAREVTHHFRLPPGSYVVIPSTIDPNCEAAFLLRLFTVSEQK